MYNNPFRDFFIHLRASYSTLIGGTKNEFNAEKGYGFITSDDGKDIFVHYTSINSEGFRSLEEGQSVTFDVVDSDRGQQASNVTVNA